MRKKIALADWLIELSTAALVITLYFMGKLTLALALLVIVICLSITLPIKHRRRASQKRNEKSQRAWPQFSNFEK